RHRRDFFFQAEDGIRDFHVTGVQTCALPICKDTEREKPLANMLEFKIIGRPYARHNGPPAVPGADYTPVAGCRTWRNAGTVRTRSEERRVGKEWRCRRSPDA